MGSPGCSPYGISGIIGSPSSAGLLLEFVDEAIFVFPFDFLSSDFDVPRKSPHNFLDVSVVLNSPSFVFLQKDKACPILVNCVLSVCLSLTEPFSINSYWPPILATNTVLINSVILFAIFSLRFACLARALSVLFCLESADCAKELFALGPLFDSVKRLW